MSQSKENIITYGKALVHAIKAFDVLEIKAGWFEPVVMGELSTTFKGDGGAVTIIERGTLIGAG